MKKICSFYSILLFLVLIAVPLLVQCRKTDTPPPLPSISFNITRNSEKEWADIILEHPLPESQDFKIETDPSEQADFVVDISITRIKKWEENSSSENDSFNGRKLLSREWLAPVIPLSETTLSIPLEDISGYNLQPLSEIGLPDKAVRVDNTLPGDTRYPLVREKHISWKISREVETSFPETAERADRFLHRWLDSLIVNRKFENPEITFLAFVGDIMPGRGTDALLLTEGGIERVFRGTLPIIEEHDLTAGNLETVVSRGGETIEKSYNFRVFPEAAAKLKEAGFDYFSFTNNHCWDYGEDGFLETLNHLRNLDLGFSGAGENLKTASLFYTKEFEGLSAKILSMGAYPQEMNGFNGQLTAKAGEKKPGILWADEDGFTAIESGRNPEKGNKIVIVMVHGGTEWQNSPTREQRELYRKMIDSGADCVIGSHPHVLQGMEVYNNGLIAYSLGNFIFPGMDETEFGEESLILSLGVYDGRILFCDFYPVAINGRVIDIDETGSILARFKKLTEDLR